MAEALSPALELFTPTAGEEPPSLAGEPVESTLPHRTALSAPESADWIQSAPWRNHVQSAHRARRDGVKIVTAVTLVVALAVGFSSLGRDDASSGFVSSLVAADCIRDSSDRMTTDKAVSACVACHLQLTEGQLAEPAQATAEMIILKCVDCHMVEDSSVRLASVETACLFRPHGG